MLRLFMLFFSLLLLSEANEYLVTRQKVLMGTFVTISVDNAHKASLKPAFKLLDDIENSLSSYKKNSPIYKLNYDKTVKLDTYSYEALMLSGDYYKQTDGYFNIAIGSVTKDLYHFGEDERVVSKKELTKASTNFNALIFNENEAIITDNIKIDLGGMGKGFGVDKVTQFLKKQGAKNAVIALSGDIRCIGECTIAVNNPLSLEKKLARFKMKDCAVSTSGNYNRYVKSKQHNHLINPKTKSSEQNFISVTLIATIPSATLDAYATAISVMPLSKAYAFLEKHDIAYIILQTNNKLIVSQNIYQYVKELELK